uniref:Uncharacterized protein n=1 Tax=Timema bartmani TaxID=61472 RepID=A0A7R9HVT2_9NEOP|nr:unnamed protein product [Timema bartmani]
MYENWALLFHLDFLSSVLNVGLFGLQLGSPYGQQPPPSQSQQMYGGPGGDQRSSWGQPQPGPPQASQQAPATPQPSPQPPPPPQPSPHPPPSPNQQHPPPQQSPQHSQQSAAAAIYSECARTRRGDLGVSPNYDRGGSRPPSPNVGTLQETKPCVLYSTFEALAQCYDGDCNRSSEAALKWSVTSPRFVVGSVSMAASAWLDTALDLAPGEGHILSSCDLNHIISELETERGELAAIDTRQ